MNDEQRDLLRRGERNAIAQSARNHDDANAEQLRCMVRELIDAMRAYEMDIDEPPPMKHRDMISRAEMLLGEAPLSTDAYRRGQKAEAVLRFVWDDLLVYLQAAEQVGKQVELIRLLDNWAKGN